MSTDVASIDLTKVDLVYALSQSHLNATLAVMLAAEQRQLAFAYDYGPSGNLVAPQDPANPDLSFDGTLAPVVDLDSGAVLVPIVDMSSGKVGTGQVLFQVTFAQGAVFQDRDRHGNRVTFTQGDPAASGGKAAWTVRLTVNLSRSALSDLPANVQANLDLLNGQYGEVFSVDQIFADLSTASFSASVDETDVPPDIGPAYWGDLCNGLAQYLRDDEAKGQVPFGFVATATGATPGDPLPALVPTAADVIVVPSPAAPDLSALVFVLMTQGRALPGQNALYAELGGLALFDDTDVTRGYALLRRGIFVDSFKSAVEVSTIPSAVSQYCSASIDQDNYQAIFTAVADTATGTLTPSDPLQSSGAVLSFSYARSSSASDPSSWGASADATASTTSTFTATASTGGIEERSQITFAGQFVVNAVRNYRPSGSGDNQEYTMPDTTFPWTAVFEIDTDNTREGAIDFTFLAAASNFCQTPTTAGGESFADWLAQALGHMQATDLGGIRDAIAGLEDNLSGQFTGAFSAFNRFVMPGSDVFLFSGAWLNDAYTLVAEIEFVSPS